MAKVAIVMGSDSDMPIMKKAAEFLDQMGIDFEMTIISAHREPDIFFEWAKGAKDRGVKVIIAGAGKAAHLPGMCAALFPMPVIGIPVSYTHLADKGNFLGSELKDGDRVIMIEDVTTSGKSMEETVPKVKGAANVEIVGLMVSLNRMEIGKGGEKCALDEVKELYGFDTAAIVDMEEVVECLYNKECNGKVVIDDTLKAAIDAYYEQYGAKH